MKTKFNGILTLLLALVVQISFAQEKTISGIVTDESGGLPGVSVLIKGTTTGTETDFDGNYTIKANTGDVLVFSFVSMKSAERTVGLPSTINVTMVSDNLLEEVIVVGYGTTTKQSFTGSAKTIKAAELEKRSVSNISQALAGEVAGVNVITTSGQPGSSATIRIRGFGSVNGNRSPLYVVDGVPFDGSINSINPSDIASTTVLKDATATAIYGARGANGVILIETKMGKAGTSVIEVDVKTGVNVSAIPRYDVMKSADEYIETAWEAMGNTGDALGLDPVDYANANLFSGSGISSTYNLWDVANVSDLIDPATGTVRTGVNRRYNPENWADHGFQSSVRTEANLKMSGGNDTTTYFSSFGYLNDVGYILNSDYNRYSTRLNITHKPKKWLTAKANIGYSYGKQTTNGQSSDSGSIFWFVDNIPSIYPLYQRDLDGNLIEDTIYGGNVFDYGVGRGFGALTNSVADATYDLSESKRHSLNGNFSFKIAFSKDFTFESKYGAQYYSRVSNSINNPFYGSAAGQGGSLFKTHRNAMTQNFLNMFSYKKSFGDHNISVLAAHESNQWKRERSSISKNKAVNLFTGLDIADNYINTSSPAGGYIEETALESYFGQVTYSLKDKYFASGSMRRDGSSRFAINKWGTFGSAGLSWIVSKENFMANVSQVDFLKVKASYGLVGDEAGVSFYSGQNGYDIGNLDGEIALVVRAGQNAHLTWETSKMFQTGVELSMFDNKIEAAVDFYEKNTEDLIFERRAAPSTGDAIETVNDGVLRNRGVEFDITAHLVKTTDFSLDFSVNGEVLDNELTAMPLDPATNVGKVLDIQGNFGRAEGRSLYDYYMREWAGVDPADGHAMWYVNYFDENANGAMDAGEEINSLTEYLHDNPDNAISESVTKVYQDATERFVNKSAIPKLRGAFRLNAKYHDFTLSSQFAYSLGGYSYDGAYGSLMNNRQVGNNNYHTDMRDRWTTPGDVVDVPRIYSNRETNANSTSTRFLTSSDYLALSNVKVGYTVPQNFVKKAGVAGVDLWFSGDNLFLLSARNGFNPATNETGASSTYRYSPLTTYTLGLRIKL